LSFIKISLSAIGISRTILKGFSEKSVGFLIASLISEPGGSVFSEFFEGFIAWFNS